MTNVTQEWVRDYIRRGFFVTSVPSGEKGPQIPGWQHLRIQEPDVAQYFPRKSNVGLILGIDGLADIDLDCPEAQLNAEHFLPSTDFVFGRKSRPRSHWFYLLDEPAATRKYLDPIRGKGDNTLLELRCTAGDGQIGLQTIVPPSRHPYGEWIRFYADGDPEKIKADVLIRAANCLAAAALLTRHWPNEKCGRNEAFLALSGALARGGFSLEHGIHFVCGVYRGLFGTDADMEQAAREANATFKKMSAGMATTGFKHLTEFIDARVVRRALQWLGLEDGEAKRGDNSEGKSQATDLVAVASAAELFHTADEEEYGSFDVDSHRETWRLKDREFKRWLAKTFYDRNGKVPNSQAMNDALSVLEGKAVFGGQQHDVSVRIARLRNAIYLDLGDKSWRAVKITPSGWKIVSRPKVRFRRPRGLRELPRPMSGGCITELRQFVNVGRRDDWVILVAWLVGAFQPDESFPVLVLQGEQGSAKSTAAKLLRSLIDPNKSLLRSPPRDIRDIMIAAHNSWIVAFDNISYLPPWLSDGLCSLATGGGFSTRELYTDAQETLFVAKRPIMLNGIDGVVVRGDLLDRSLVLQLPEIADRKRKPEKKLWARFDEARPYILGALLDAVAGALRNASNVHMSALPRMADFAIWSTAAEESLGWRPGTVARAITNNQKETKTLPLDASPITPALRTMLRANNNRFKGPAEALLRELEFRTQWEKRPRNRPKNPQVLSSSLRRLAPNLRAAGVHVKFRQTPGSGSVKSILITNRANFCDAGDASDADGEKQ